jgi:nicotinate phosphoribosyltransferase
MGRSVVDFALRRTHGTDAGMKAARAGFITGFAGTSNVRAAKLYGIPPVGTMAHSFVSSFDSELAAFRAYAASFPNSAILLIDTYDTLRGARNAVQVAREMAARGQGLQGVRLDSGDLAALAVEVRRILDEAGLTKVKITGSGGLDEYELARFSAANIPFDSYGVGTKVGVSADAPWADTAYKLVEYANRPVLKLSTAKESWPGKKQVFRFADVEAAADVIALRDEQITGAKPLLEPVLREGKLTGRLPSLEEVRSLCRSDLDWLPHSSKDLVDPTRYPVKFSGALQGLRQSTEKNLTV